MNKSINIEKPALTIILIGIAFFIGMDIMNPDPSIKQRNNEVVRDAQIERILNGQDIQL